MEAFTFSQLKTTCETVFESDFLFFIWCYVGTTVLYELFTPYSTVSMAIILKQNKQMLLRTRLVYLQRTSFLNFKEFDDVVKTQIQ